MVLTLFLSTFRSIVKAFCRMPLFYSYSCIPPSVWGKDWNPKFNLDMELIKFDLPVIPSHFLHDEIVLEEFVYRYDLFSLVLFKILFEFLT